MGRELWGRLEVEGLDTQDLTGEIRGKNLRETGRGCRRPYPGLRIETWGTPILLLTSDLGHPPRFCIS